MSPEQKAGVQMASLALMDTAEAILPLCGTESIYAAYTVLRLIALDALKVKGISESNIAELDAWAEEKFKVAIAPDVQEG